MSKFKPGDRVTISVSPEYTPKEHNGAKGTVVERDNVVMGFIPVSLDGHPDTYEEGALFYEKELTLIEEAEFPAGTEVKVRVHNVDYNGPMKGKIGTVTGHSNSGIWPIRVEFPGGRREIFRASELEPTIAKQPEPPAQGMTSDDLADYVEGFIRETTGRIRGVGDEQYSQANGQKFETLPVADLFKWAREEVQDIANYAAMLDIRLARLQEAFEGKQ